MKDARLTTLATVPTVMRVRSHECCLAATPPAVQLRGLAGVDHDHVGAKKPNGATVRSTASHGQPMGASMVVEAFSGGQQPVGAQRLAQTATESSAVDQRGAAQRRGGAVEDAAACAGEVHEKVNAGRGPAR